jgi:cysteine desulfurase family protein (TIGR01976 family)
MPIDPHVLRQDFPALTSNAVYFDNPGGTQVPHQVIDRMVDYLVTKNANHGGAFTTSAATDVVVAEARLAMADFLAAPAQDDIIFGPNMTTLTFAISRSLAREFNPGDEIIVTRLDHDANVSPWLLAAEDRGCKVHWLDFDPETCTLRLDELEKLLNKKTRLLAVGYASNSVGTINPVARLVEMAHSVGAMCYIDAVHFAPHGSIDVTSLDCDFLVASAYKFFGPHLGVLYGKSEHLERLRAYKVRPAPDLPPGKFETGTANFEGLAGLVGAMEYLCEVGQRFGAEAGAAMAQSFSGRRRCMKQSMATVRGYEMELTRTLLKTLAGIPGLRMYGLRDEASLERRVPTVSFTLRGKSPGAVARALAEREIYVWDGNYYAPSVTERLGVEESGGMVRVGLAHYNTPEEIARLEEALRALVKA